MGRIRSRLRRPSAPLVISMIALFVALTGTSFASSNIVALAKRALTADKAKTANTAKVANTAKNALLLNSQTAAQIAATPGPADTLNGQTAAQIIAAAAAQGSGSVAARIKIRSTGWNVDSPGTQGANWYANCAPGEKAIAGGFDQTSPQGEGVSVPVYSRPTTDGNGWWFKAKSINDASLPTGGSVWVICVT